MSAALTRDQAVEILRTARDCHELAAVRDELAAFLNVGGRHRRQAADRLSGLVAPGSDVARAVEAYLHRRPERRCGLRILDGAFDFCGHTVRWYWTTRPDGQTGVVGEIDGQHVEASWASFRRRVLRLAATDAETTLIRQHLNAGASR